MDNKEPTKQGLIEQIQRLRRRNAELEMICKACGNMDPKCINKNCKLSSLIENMPGMGYACMNDGDWTMLYVSGGCKNLTGYNADDLLENNRLSYSELIHPEDRKRVWDMVQDAVAKKEQFRLLYRIITSAGKEKWVWERGLGIFSPDGKLLSLHGYIEDMAA